MLSKGTVLFLSSGEDPFGEGMWNGKRIKDLETCHLQNIVDMLKKRGTDVDEDRLAGRKYHLL